MSLVLRGEIPRDEAAIEGVNPQGVKPAFVRSLNAALKGRSSTKV